jgi:hypothetical protein
MPDDLIPRLRDLASANLGRRLGTLLAEAADQIEALQVENRQQRALVRSSGQEVNRLRDQLSEPS